MWRVSGFERDKGRVFPRRAGLHGNVSFFCECVSSEDSVGAFQRVLSAGAPGLFAEGASAPD
jgi:hypothetical protein